MLINLKERQDEIDKAIQDWKDRVYAGLEARISNQQYKLLMQVLKNHECIYCEDKITHIDVYKNSTKIFLRCQSKSCREVIVEMPKTSILYTSLWEIATKEKDKRMEVDDSICNYYYSLIEQKNKKAEEAIDNMQSSYSNTASASSATTVSGAAFTRENNRLWTGGITKNTSSTASPWIDAGNLNYNHNHNTIKENGGKNMFNVNSIMKGFQFGPVTGNRFKLSPLGIAFETKDGYAVYNTEKEEITDVTGMTFDINNMIYAMPVAINKVKENDIILHNGTAMIVKEVKEKSLVAVYPFLSEIKEIMPVRNMFGFNFYTKITPLMDFGTSLKPDGDNPFGNLMPFMLMSQGSSNNMNPMMLMALMGGKIGDGEMSQEMLMAMALGGNQDGNGMMQALMMSKLLK